jgi:hypothetical protein
MKLVVRIVCQMIYLHGSDGLLLKIFYFTVGRRGAVASAAPKKREYWGGNGDFQLYFFTVCLNTDETYHNA